MPLLQAGDLPPALAAQVLALQNETEKLREEGAAAAAAAARMPLTPGEPHFPQGTLWGRQNTAICTAPPSMNVR
jgi:hypothetical protein